MRKRLIPYCHAKNIYEIDINFFVSQDVKYLFVDLDNTLDSYKTLTPSEKAIELKKKLDDVNIELIIVSNNTSKRVSNYAEALNVKYFSGVRKPFSAKLNKIIDFNQYDRKNIMMIGDQVVTDIQSANGANIRSILVDKLVKEDQPTTRFNRIFDKIYRKKLIKKHLYKEWGELYGN